VFDEDTSSLSSDEDTSSLSSLLDEDVSEELDEDDDFKDSLLLKQQNVGFVIEIISYHKLIT
jgi:hypothetical protein